MRAISCCCLLLVVSLATAETRSRFVEDGTFLVASVDVEQLVEPDAMKRLFAGFDSIEKMVGDGLVPSREQRVQGVTQVASALQQAGVQRLFVTAAIDDLRIGYAPLFVGDMGEGRDPKELLSLLGKFPQIEAKVVDGRVWISTAKSLKRYRELTASERSDLLEPLQTAKQSGKTLAAVISPGHDARRVIRELWPTLPESLGGLAGPLIADGLERLELTAHLGEPAVARLALVARDDESSDRFAESLAADLKAGEAWVQQNAPDYAELATMAAKVLSPQTEGDVLSIELTTESPAVQALFAGVMAPAIQKARAASRRAAKMNDMKQIALAMHNHENANGCFPEPIVDSEGKPLLSWRVAILPYLEQGALFDRFRLDEPWDSPHNLECAKVFPLVYFQNTTDKLLTEQGKTTYLRPVYPGSDPSGEIEPASFIHNGTKVFRAVGDTFRAITDGTSMTILVAEVAPEHAVPWTKPADWRVNLNDPMAKLRTDKRDGFVSCRHDGSAHYIAFDYSSSGLRKLITKAGGEVLTEEERP